MNYIITSNPDAFSKIGNYNFVNLDILKRLPETIAIDTETTGLSPIDSDVFCVQIGTGRNNILIDLQDYPYTKSITFNDVIPYIKDKILVFQNAVFDIKFFYKYGFYPERVRDTMVCSMILHNGEGPSIRHGLGDIFERELKIKVDKTEQKNIHKVRLTTARAIHYCFNDVDRLLELHSDLEMKLNNYGALPAYYLNCDFLKALAYMENCGLPIDVNLWKEKMVEDEINSKKAQRLIEEYIYDNLPKHRKSQTDLFDTKKKIKPLLSSPTQMIPVFKDLGINVLDDEGKESINEKVINKTKHPFVDIWLQFKGAEQRCTTFGQNVLDKVINGRLYGGFKPLVDTGRISSRKGGINFLNIPSDKTTRSCFKATEGNVIIDADYSQQESRILAHKSQDENSILNVVQNRDPHSLLAREAFPEIKNLTDKEIKANHNDLRQLGKIANFTFAFGGNGYTLSKSLNLSTEEGDRIYNAYVNLYKDVFTWGDSIYDKAIKNGYIESEEGFKLKLPFYNDYLELEKRIKDLDWELYKDGKLQYKHQQKIIELRKTDKTVKSFVIPDKPSYDYFKKKVKMVSEFFKQKSSYKRLCLNNPIQGCGSFIIKRSLIYLFDYIKTNNHLGRVKIVNSIYDENVLEVEKCLAEEYTKVLAKCMQDAGNYYVKSDLIEMEADAFYSDNWHSAKSQ